MHRSGTSLITNWLSRCGLEIGERLAAGNAGNVEGHFEDVEFLKLHEEILRGPLSAILEELKKRPGIKGEFVVVVGAEGSSHE